MAIAIIPGSFDPITFGHMDMICRAAKLFSEVYVAVLENSEKVYAFSAEERLSFVKRCTANLPNVKAECCLGLAAEYAKKVGAAVIVKGVRNAVDLAYETQILWANNKLTGGQLDTVFLAATGDTAFISSSLVREFARYGADLKTLVSGEIVNEIAAKFYEGED